MLDNIPMDKTILRKWLEAGYVENGIMYPSRKGTPQGGIISPTLSNMTLDGLEEVVRSAVPRRNRVNFNRYTEANPYSPRYARYFRLRRNKKDGKLLPALSAREFRTKFA